MDPDECLSNGQLKSLSMELLALIPMDVEPTPTGVEPCRARDLPDSHTGRLACRVEGLDDPSEISGFQDHVTGHADGEQLRACQLRTHEPVSVPVEPPVQKSTTWTVRSALLRGPLRMTHSRSRRRDSSPTVPSRSNYRDSVPADHSKNSARSFRSATLRCWRNVVPETPSTSATSSADRARGRSKYPSL